MGKYISSLLAAAALGCLSASAIMVETTPGNLKSLLDNPSQLTELTVTGSINAVDLDFIDTSMPALVTLDLSGTKIMPFKEYRLRGLSSHPGATIPERIFVGSKIKTLRLPSQKDLVIGAAAFAGSAIEIIDLSGPIATVGDGAFTGCTSLKTVTLGQARLGQGAFAGCTSLSLVDVTAPVAVPDLAFSGCTALADVKGSTNITSIGNRSFSNCKGLRSFDFSSSLTSIGSEAFAAGGLESVDLSSASALQSVGEWAFAAMPSVKAVNLGQALTVGRGVVFNCPSLVSFTFSSAATAVPDMAFAKDTAIDTTGIFNRNVTHIGDYALSGLSHITTITLPSTLEYIGDHAMEGMTSLSDIHISQTEVPALGEGVWDGIDPSKVNVSVPEQALEAYRSTPVWQDFNIYGVSGVTDAPAAVAVLRARFIGDNLTVEFAGVELRTVTLYDIEGRALASATVEGRDGSLTLDASGLQRGAVAVVAATTADGHVSSIKMAKN